MKETTPILTIKDLTMKYPGKTQPTLKKINLTVAPGEALGFIGRNGSGKSTTIKCITGILNYQEGQIFISDYDLVTNPIEAKSLIGYNPDNHAVYEEMTGREYGLFIASVYGQVEYFQQNFDQLVEQFEITNAVDKKIASYSHGMKQKICLIATIIHKPELWILDEPFTGLDVVASYHLKTILKKHKEAKKAIFLTSHDITTISQICDRVLIIEAGQIIEEIILSQFSNQTDLEQYFYQKLKIISPTNYQEDQDV